MSTLGELLRKYRLEKGYSQQDLADKTGILRQSIGFMENNRYERPSADKLLLLAKVLEVDFKVFYEAAGYQVEKTPNKDVMIFQLESIEKQIHEIITRLKQS
jgi:transcriptional regulator with XRE-family HTH domain